MIMKESESTLWNKRSGNCRTFQSERPISDKNNSAQLVCGERYDEHQTPLSREERATTRCTQSSAMEVSTINLNEDQKGPPDKSKDPERDPLLEWELMVHDHRIAEDMAEFWNATRKARGRDQNQVRAHQPPNWKASLE